KRLIDILSNQILVHFKALSFDIERNKGKIKEIAWNESDTWNFHVGEGEVNDALPKFKELVEPGKHLVVGHNIIEFDCPILEEKGIVFNYNNLWDTLRMEVLLSPELKNYALKTSHTAEEDAQLTISLFVNQ